MIRVHRSDCSRNAFIEGLQHWTEVAGVKICRYWLVQQFISQDRSLIPVSLGYSLPQSHSHVDEILILKEEWIAIAIINVGSSLASRGSMHVQHQVEIILH